MCAAPFQERLHGESAWPDRLDARRLPDEALAEAYDATPPPLRGCIKNALALAHAVYGECPDSLERKCVDAARGFTRVTHAAPAPWTLAAFTPAYASGPRLAAALMPALLAHVPLLGAVCVGGIPSLSARVVLELAGVEDAFSLHTQEFGRLLRDMASCGVGRLLLLHAGELAPLRRDAEELRIPVWEEARPPRLLTVADSGHMHEHIAWGHPDASLTEISPPLFPAASRGRVPALPEADAVFCGPGQEVLFLSQVSLTLLPGMEGCWLHDCLSPHFFLRNATALGAIAPSVPFS